jgi:hypothetical protein
MLRPTYIALLSIVGLVAIVLSATLLLHQQNQLNSREDTLDAPDLKASISPFQSPSPTNTNVVSVLSPKSVEPSMSCADLQQRINAELLKVNYCSIDSDCSSEVILIRGEDGEHRCGDGLPNYYHNDNADTKVLKQLGRQYTANQCSAAPPGGCRGPREDEVTRVGCVKNKCVLTFSAK